MKEPKINFLTWFIQSSQQTASCSHTITLDLIIISESGAGGLVECGDERRREGRRHLVCQIG